MNKETETSMLNTINRSWAESLKNALAELERQAEKELEVPAEPQTIAQIVEEVSEEICDHYCKWPEKYKGLTQEALEMQMCNECPLLRL